MSGRRCDVTIDADTKKVLGRIFDGDRLVKTQAWYLGRLIEEHPDEVRAMVERKYREWCGAYGVLPADMSVAFGPLPPEPAED